MKRACINVVLTLVCAAGLAIPIASAQTLAPSLKARVEARRADAGDSIVSVVVFLERDLDATLGKLNKDKLLTRRSRIETLVSELKQSNPLPAERIAAQLRRVSVSAVTRHWIVPAFSASIPVSEVEAIATLPGIRLIVENMALSYDPPVEMSAAPSSANVVSDELYALGVPYLWQLGLKGSGRLVCSFDTGVDVTHPALALKWRGNLATLASSWFSKVTPDAPPVDKTGHGTHTMGIMVGSDGADQFGVAPEAQWISAGVIDQGRPLQTTLSDIIEAFEWVLDPDGDPSTVDDVPDVILNSWGVPKGMFSPCDDTFSEVIDVVEAAGIVTIFAAGNEGPAPSSLRLPADRCTTPTSSFAVGAVDRNRVIAEFSSRGPSSCDATKIKPEVVAPGVTIRSSAKGGGYSYMSGTSMAAPFVAGLVLLMREYNPDATVEDIKNALLMATTDLGDSGEDNDYGHGFVDATRLLDYLPAPASPDFSIATIQVSDDGYAWPGEEFGLQIVLNNIGGYLADVVGTISTKADYGVSILVDEAHFSFGFGGSTAMNFSPFLIGFDSTLFHGQEIPFTVALSRPTGEVFDSVGLFVTVGVAPRGRIASHGTSSIDFTVSDFGQYGLGQGSIYGAGGEGFCYKGSGNLLYEAGVIVGRNQLQLSSSIRDSAGDYRVSDFESLEPLTDTREGDDGSIRRSAVLTDDPSSIPIPITVTQETITYTGEDGLIVVRYVIRNESVEKLTDVSFGFMADFDLGDNERIAWDASQRLLYNKADAYPMVGIVGLENVAGFRTMENGKDKTGFTRAQKYDLISQPTHTPDTSAEGDLMFVVSSVSFTLLPGDEYEVALALVAGSDASELYKNAMRAQSCYGLTTDLGHGDASALPVSAVLHQNYPNPFNPSTTISFSLSQAGNVSLVIYNSLGQRVKSLVNERLAAGDYAVDWNGTSDRGVNVASGVYYYRLTTARASHARKMVLLK